MFHHGIYAVGSFLFQSERENYPVLGMVNGTLLHTREQLGAHVTLQRMLDNVVACLPDLRGINLTFCFHCNEGI